MAASTATGYLSFDGIGMVFPDGTEAIRDVSFSVDKGEFVTVVGPSGCGKSTLLKIASGLLDPTRGSRARRPRAARATSSRTRRCCPGAPCSRTSSCCPSCTGCGKAERAQLAKRAIDTVGLKGFEHHYPKALSGGMRMRCSLARTLTLNPPLFLFDEPFGAVDEITREHLNEETQRLFVSEGFAGLFITHSISEAVFLSTRVLVMSARPGRIVAEFDVPFELPAQPRPALPARVRPAQRRDLARPARCAHMSITASRSTPRPARGRGDRYRRGQRPASPGRRAAGAGRSTQPVASRRCAVALPPIVLGLVDRRRLVLHLVRDARGPRRFLLRPPHQVIEGRLPRLGELPRDPRGALGRAPRWR